MLGGMADAWSSGDAYEPYVGRWSRKLAPKFLAWAGVGQGAGVLDVGCGTGALSEAALAAGAREVVGVDPSAAYVAHAAAHVGGKNPSARFEVADAQALPFPDASFDAVVSGLVLNFVPDPSRAAAEMRRAARPGGVVAAYVWDYAGRMELMRHFWDAAVALDPHRAGPLDEGVRFPLCQPGPLEALFRGAGLREVASTAIDQPTVFRDFNDYWRPFLGGQAPAPGYCMSLSEEARARLRERIRSHLPVAADGSIALIARAWAVRGRA